ncbi:MAG: polysaccharide biosynthesis tyrosine autokinase [Gemmatimonadota bacterium]|nr:polysaccharide biosynthesis tyrosine autokinase [Gemmatimonadota bacterium]
MLERTEAPIRALVPEPGPSSPAAASWIQAPRPVGTVLKRRRLTLALALGGSLAVVGGYTALQVPEYSSVATILVEGGREGQIATPLDVLGRVGSVSPVQTEAEMLRSRRVVEPVVDEMDLHIRMEWDGIAARPAEAFPHFDASPETPPGVFWLRKGEDGSVGLFSETGGFPMAMARPGDTLRVAGLSLLPPVGSGWQEIRLEADRFAAAVNGVFERVSVRTDPAVDLIQMSCRAADPAEAQALCNGIASRYIQLRTVLQRAEASSTARFLGEQVDVVRGHLAAVEDSLERFASRNRIVALEEQATEEVRRLAELEAERQAIERERIALAGLVGRVESSPRHGALQGAAGGGGGAPASARYRDLASFPTFLQQGPVSQLVSTLVELENERGALIGRRTESSPDVLALDTRIREVENQLGDFGRSYLDNLDSRTRALSSSLAASQTRLDVLPAQQVAVARMERQASLLGELFGFLETRRREAEVAEKVELPSVRILDHASEPIEPVSPSWSTSLLAALFLGLGGGLAMAFYQEFTDSKVRDRREVEKGTGLSVLGIIPRLPRAGAVFEGQIIRGRVPRGGGAARREEVVREAFRGLLTDLEFVQLPGGRGHLRTLAVVSAGPGEGKTFTASNIALARASVGSNTLLMDADMRAGGVSEFFGIPSLTGLSEVLSGEVAMEDVVRLMRIEKAKDTSSGALAVVPAGRPTPRSAALLQGEAFEALLEGASARFDMVVVDTPPLNVLSDAMPVAAAVDGVLLVVRGGRTERDGLEMALHRLERAGANVIGVVLNDSEVPKRYGVYNTAYALQP